MTRPPVIFVFRPPVVTGTKMLRSMMLRVICVLAELSVRRHCTFWRLYVNEHVRHVVKKDIS